MLQENSTAKSLVFYLCCNTTLCNNISSSGEGDSAAGGVAIVEGDGRDADFVFEDGPIVNPIPGTLAMMDLIMLGGVGLIGVSVGLIVDLAATGRGPFKES